MTTINFLTKDECKRTMNIDISFKTNFVNDGKKKNVYKVVYDGGDADAPKCIEYFDTDINTLYIGINQTNILNIISLKSNEDVFDPELKIKILELQDTYNNSKSYYSARRVEFMTFLQKELKNMEEKKLNPKCTKYIILHEAKNEIDQLNRLLNCDKYYIGIDYWFDSKKNTNITSFNTFHDDNYLMLGMFETATNNCVASIIFIAEHNDKPNEVEIFVETNSKYEGKKMNKLLHAAMIIIANKLNIKKVISRAIHPVSAYIMYHLNAKLFGEDNYGNITDNIKIADGKVSEFQEILNGTSSYVIICEVDINTENIEKARNVFETTTFQCESVVSDGGRKTRKRRKRVTKFKTRRRRSKSHRRRRGFCSLKQKSKKHKIAIN